jgi:hypothetical protein
LFYECELARLKGAVLVGTASLRCTGGVRGREGVPTSRALLFTPGFRCDSHGSLCWQRAKAEFTAAIDINGQDGETYQRRPEQHLLLGELDAERKTIDVSRPTTAQCWCACTCVHMRAHTHTWPRQALLLHGMIGFGAVLLACSTRSLFHVTRATRYRIFIGTLIV